MAKRLAPREQVVTNYSQGDGFGSQFQNVIAAAVYADLHNKVFLYTPFTTMEHNYDNSADFIAKKEWLINFIGNFDLNPYKDVPLKNYKDLFDKNVAACAQSKMLQKIKTVFRANKKRADYFDEHYFNIAIHIRRPNPHDSRIDGTNTPDKFFSAIMQALRTRYKAHNVQFHVYSQGDPKNFELFAADDVVFHLNESVEDTFIGMVLADVLVSSASSFSYTAALISNGTVYYIPFWHAPLPHWTSIVTLLPTSKKRTYRACIKSLSSIKKVRALKRRRF